MSILIVGSGVCGLALARNLHDKKHLQVTVLEKSKGVGGRLATRRTASGRFDHGAQFYSVKADVAALDQRWRAANLARVWMEHNGVQRMACPSGMTGFAKNLIEGLDVRLEARATAIKKATNGWQVQVEDQSPNQKHFAINADTVILTCPLPQSLELLDKSQINFDSSLRDVHYAKALVGLFEGVESECSSKIEKGYVENPSSSIFSISDQSTKGLSATTAWTVTMAPPFSEVHFESDETTNLNLIISEITKFVPNFKFEHAQLKKWRYSHPLSSAPTPYHLVDKGLYLAGDAFGRPSINGAVSSANALLKSEFQIS